MSYSEDKIAELLAYRAKRALDIHECLKVILETADKFGDEIDFMAQSYWLHRNRDLDFPGARAYLRRIMTNICSLHEQLDDWCKTEAAIDHREKWKDKQHEERSRGDSPYH